MSRILFATWDGGGNVPPALEMAKALRRRGDEVRFLGHAEQRETIVNAGFPFEPYSKHGIWAKSERHSGLRGALGFLGVLTSRSVGDDLLASAKNSPVDLVVIDFVLFGALRAAQRSGLRNVVLVHSLYDAVLRTMIDGAPGWVARLAGYRPRQLFASADLVLVPTVRELDRPPRQGGPIAATYTGPAEPEVAASAQPEVATDPTVLVSLSTTYIGGQAAILQKILDSLAQERVRLIVTSGPSVDPEELSAPANAEIHRYLSHAEVMPSASLVIGHGGHSTTMRALSHGLPLLILPMSPLFDQVIIAEAVQEHGVGLMLGKDAAPADIRTAVAALLADTRYRREAERLATGIRDARGAETAADEVHAVMAAIPRQR